MTGSLLKAWHRTARRLGRERAVVEAATGATATFAELAERAAAWRERHFGPGSAGGRIAVFSGPNSIAWLEMFLGLLEAGAVVLPLDPGEPPSSQAAAATRIGAAWLWENGRLAPQPGRRKFSEPSVCLIKLTSGSTGIPRALPFTADQMLADTAQVCGTMGIRRPDLNYGIIPFGHSYGLASIVIALAARGVPVVCGSGALPHAVAGDFRRWRPTVFPGVPAIWRALAGSEVEASALRSLRLAISAGARLPSEVERDFATRFDRKICSFYGSTETGGIAYDSSGRAAADGHVGRPLRGVTIRPAPGGRIIISSRAVFTTGNRRALSLSKGRWIPPDRAVLDARGRVVLAGRRGQMIKVGGRRVNLQEVAARLRQIPGVRDAWVGAVGAPEPVIAAAVATTLTPTALRAALLADTAPWKIPKKLIALSELPVTARGKLDTRALIAAFKPFTTETQRAQSTHRSKSL